MSNRVHLSSVTQINPRLPKGIDETQQVSFLPMASVSEEGKILRQDTRKLSETKKGYTYFERNDVLLAKITPCFENGKATLASDLEHPIGFGSTEFHVLRPDPKKLDAKYLFYLVWSRRFRYLGQKAMTGAAGQRRVPTDFLKTFEIPLPPLDDQKRIAHLLGKVEGLIARRKHHLQQLDDLLKSVFLEMFGDPVRNENGWEKKPFAELLDNIDSGKSPKCEARVAADDEWGVLKLGAVTSCIYKEVENKALPTGIAPSTKDEVKAGDLLFSRKNTYGLVAACVYVFETRSRLLLPDLIFRFVLKEDAGINPIFLWKLLIAGSQRKNIQALAGGAAGSMPNISKANLKQVLLPVPPIDLQNNFASIVAKVEGLKSRYQQSLTDLENLYGALSQKAFKGELDLSRVPLPVQEVEQTVIEDVETTRQRDIEETDQRPALAELVALTFTVGRKALLDQLLSPWLDQLGDTPFSAQQFMAHVEQRASDLIDAQNAEARFIEHEDVQFGPVEYDHLKTRLFEALEQGLLTQGYDDANNRVQLATTDK
jgi:type I restriction enzyme S subunit